MSELFDSGEGKKEALKKLIKRLHEGAEPEEVKEKFKEVIKGITATDIAKVEEELIKEGLPREEIQRLCDVHLAVFRESLEKEKPSVPAWHPIHILKQEHKILLNVSNELRAIAQKIKSKEGFEAVSENKEKLNQIVHHLKESEKHYVREENVLFPYLEKHGIKEPPSIMWTEHNKIREIKRKTCSLIEKYREIDFQDFKKKLGEVSLSLADMLSNHFYKENNILFPTALKVIGKDEFKHIRGQFDELGYCCFTPEPARIPLEKKQAAPSTPERGDRVTFETGTLSEKEIEAIFNTLPVDITYIDKEDTVRYFNQTSQRIFPRAKAVIGRKVQQCHPQKSIHIVNRILEDFKSSRRDVARFWINVDEKLIYIRYFPVQDKNGEYIGCMEVTQDVTGIKKLEGEKRILDEEKEGRASG